MLLSSFVNLPCEQTIMSNKKYWTNYLSLMYVGLNDLINKIHIFPICYIIDRCY